MADLIRPEIRSLGEYTLRQYPHRVKLNQNENPYELPAEIKREIVERLASMRWSRYPEFVPRKQIDMLAEFTGWRADGILLGNGSNDLLQLLFTSVLEKGKCVVISQPTFTLYRLLARSLGADVREVNMRRPFAFDVDEIIRVTNSSRAAMLVLCTPNNPTGSVLTRGDVVRILESTETLVVLDEAYVQFARESQIELLKRYDRLVVLQTFSKAMGAAGLRFGYSLSAPGLAKDLAKVKLPYSVNLFTLLAAEVLMSHWTTISGWIKTICDERERVRRELETMPEIAVSPSEANFLLFEVLRTSPAEVFQALLRSGILVRDVSSYPMLERGLRVSIGSPDDNTEFLKALREAI